jgi:hypothetical protein
MFSLLPAGASALGLAFQSNLAVGVGMKDEAPDVVLGPLGHLHGARRLAPPGGRLCGKTDDTEPLARAVRFRHAERVELDVRGSFPEATLTAIRAFVEPQRTLHDVVVAGLASRPERGVRAVIVQDEYTHDVVVRWDDDTYLVYDTT